MPLPCFAGAAHKKQARCCLLREESESMAAPSSSTAPHAPTFSQILVEYRAGKMIMEGTTVKPDPRKGLFRLTREEEGLVHFQWLERTHNFPEDDLVVFPEEAIFEKVKESNDCVYVLKFRQDDRKYFLWMQEPNVNGDVPLSKIVNFYLNGPQEDEQDGEDQVLTFSKDPHEAEKRSNATVEILSSSAATSESLLPPQGPVQLADLQRILSTIRPSETNSEAMLPRDTGPSLSEILKPELVVPLLENCHLEERLAPFLPEGPWTTEAIAELIQSPQFHQQVDAFTHVLRSGQIDLAQFGIDSSKYNFTVSSFLEAIEDQAAENSESTHVSTPGESGHEGSGESPHKKGDCKGDPMEEGR